jgi:hypothetical protein
VTRSQKTGQTFTTHKGIIKASIRYIAHRPDRDSKTVTRKLFNEQGDELSKDHAYQMIDATAPGMKFVRLVISPDPKREDGNRDLYLRKLTLATMGALATKHRRAIRFIAAVHDDHTEIRHIHVIALIDKRLCYKDFDTLRLAATDECRNQRRLLDRSTALSRSLTLRIARQRAPLRKPAPRATRPVQADTPGRCATLSALRRSCASYRANPVFLPRLPPENVSARPWYHD